MKIQQSTGKGSHVPNLNDVEDKGGGEYDGKNDRWAFGWNREVADNVNKS